MAGQDPGVHEVDRRERPCAGQPGCPWRVEADLPAFSVADMRKLRAADGQPGREAAMDAPVMACHKDQPGTAHPLRLCAGWLAVVGPHHLGVRMAVLTGELPAQALQPGDDWPELHESLAAMIDSWPENPGAPPPSRSRQRRTPPDD